MSIGPPVMWMDLDDVRLPVGGVVDGRPCFLGRLQISYARARDEHARAIERPRPLLLAQLDRVVEIIDSSTEYDDRGHAVVGVDLQLPD
jgi:hypothetical protein